MTSHLSGLLQKEVSRKEFLGMSSLAVASLFGFGAAIKLLTGKSLSGSTSHLHNVGSTFGSGSYGGSKEGV